MEKRKSSSLVILMIAVFLTSDLIFSMVGLLQLEIPMLIGWILTAGILIKSGKIYFNRQLRMGFSIILVLNVLVSAGFSFLTITCEGLLQIDYINNLYVNLFGCAVVPSEYKWADNILNCMILSEMFLQMLFRILVCIGLFQNSSKIQNNKVSRFVRTASLVYVPIYIIVKPFLYISDFIISICRNSNSIVRFSKWLSDNDFTIMIYLYIICAVAFWIIAFTEIVSEKKRDKSFL